MKIATELANWAASVSAAHSHCARELAQDALLDVTACIIGGSPDATTQKILEFVKQFGTGSALAMGSQFRFAAPWAALVSATAAHALDFDDNFAPAVTHATAVLAPALFALADEEEVSGDQIIDAYIVGLELQARIGRLVNPEHYERGWHATSTIGAIGTAGGCARLLGLRAEQILAAMSIAFSMASGSKKQFGSMMKPVHAGLAAKNAVVAARMAQAGILGDVEPLVGRWGFSDLYAERRNDDGAGRAVLGDLGTSFAIEMPGLLPKRFPCCGAAHRTLDGIVELRKRHQIPFDAVDCVEAFIPAFARANLRFDEPQDEFEARFSLTYCAARVLESGRLTLADLTPERVREPLIRPLLRRFKIHVKPGSVSEELSEHATPAITRVVLKTGQAYEIGIAVAKGARSVPFTNEEKSEKFLECCRWAGKEHSAQALLELARSMHRIGLFSEFSRAFALEYRNV